MNYSLHLSAKEAIKQKNDLVRKVREIVITLKRPRAMEDFRMELKRKDVCLKQDVDTRWNSASDVPHSH